VQDLGQLKKEWSFFFGLTEYPLSELNGIGLTLVAIN